MNRQTTSLDKERTIILGVPKLSIIIVNWNTSMQIVSCLQSMAQFLPVSLDYETIIVDNASTDGSSQVLCPQFPRALYIQNEHNLGFSAANNRGIRHARGKYVLLLNPDTQMVEDCVTPLLKKLDDDETIGLIGCKLLNPDTTLQWSGDLFPVPFHEINLWFNAERQAIIAKINAAIESGSPVEVDCLIGAFQIVPRQLLLKIGLLDEQLFMYGEDLDLCYRIKKSGKKIVYDPSVSIIHYGGQSAAQIWTSTERLKRVRESLFKIHYRHFGVFVAQASLFLRTVIAWCRWFTTLVIPSTSADVKSSFRAEAEACSHTLFHSFRITRNMQSKSL